MHQIVVSPGLELAGLLAFQFSKPCTAGPNVVKSLLNAHTPGVDNNE